MGQPINKKIKNAESLIIEGIKFRSKLEYRVYKQLKELLDVPILYEAETLNLVPSFTPTIPFISTLVSNPQSKVRSITYTPDFTFEYRGKHVYLECKGFENDTYPIKRKLFRKFLESREDKDSIIFCEIRNIRECKQLIDKLNEIAI